MRGCYGIRCRDLPVWLSFVSKAGLAYRLYASECKIYLICCISVKFVTMKSFDLCLRSFHAKVLIVALILFTGAVNCILYQVAKTNQAGAQFPSYSLKLEVRNRKLQNDSFNFVSSCFVSDAGYSCRPSITRVVVYPGLFSLVNISSEAAPGGYHGIRVQINDSNGKSLYVKSLKLQNELVFDGKNYSVFKNLKGIKIHIDSESGLVVWDIASDMASFDLDDVFEVENVPGTPVVHQCATFRGAFHFLNHDALTLWQIRQRGCWLKWN